jgi:alpha-tubulin suppressor-like RCC1 family protein
MRTGAAFALSLAMMLAGGCGVAPLVQPERTQLRPIEVVGLEGVTAVSAGNGFTVALKSDGTVWTWGTNDAGQLGDGTTTNRSEPVQVAELRSVLAIASGSKHSLALKSDGTVWAWGSPNFGGIGDATTRGHVTPVQVQALAGSSLLSGVVRVAAGRGTSLALKSDGTLWAWGDNSTASFGDGTRTSRLTAIQLPPPPGSVVAMAVASHSLAVAADGSVWAAGANLRGELCDGSFSNRVTRVPVPGLAEVIGVATAKDHSLLLRRDGSVWACGRGDEGQLGNGAHTNSPSPVRVSDVSNCVAVGAGFPNLALDADGSVFAWGSKRLVGGGSMPARVNGLPRIVAIVATEDHGILVTSDGHVWILGG